MCVEPSWNGFFVVCGLCVKLRTLTFELLHLTHVKTCKSSGCRIKENRPCKKYDMDSHGNSMSFHVTTRLGGSLVKIHTKFHDNSMSFVQVFFVSHAGTWHGFWTSSSNGISMALAKKMMGFPLRIWSHFRTKPNCRQKDGKKSVSCV